MPRAALVLGEGEGDVTADEDVGNEDDDERPGADESPAADDDGGAVDVESGAEDDTEVLGVTEAPPPLLVEVWLVEAGLVLPEADVEFVPLIVNCGLAFPESPNTTTM